MLFLSSSMDVIVWPKRCACLNAFLRTFFPALSSSQDSVAPISLFKHVLVCLFAVVISDSLPQASAYPVMAIVKWKEVCFHRFLLYRVDLGDKWLFFFFWHRLWWRCHLPTSWFGLCKRLCQCSICSHQYPSRPGYGATFKPLQFFLICCLTCFFT